MGLGLEVGLPLGTERRPRNLIMGVCLERIWVARIFAVVCVCVWVCGLWCEEFEETACSGEEVWVRARGFGFLAMRVARDGEVVRWLWRGVLLPKK